jgi:hypothetical protein
LLAYVGSKPFSTASPTIHTTTHLPSQYQLTTKQLSPT